MELTITPTGATLGATVTGIDLANLDRAGWKIMENAFHEYGVLIFPGQALTDDAQIGFANRFGDIELLTADPEKKAVPISNQRPDGDVMGADEFRYKALRGNEGWHTDSSYMPLAAKASVLSALQVPSAGGETEWADMRAAYDELDAAMKQRLETLSAYHSLYYSQSRIGHLVETGAGYGYHTKGAPLRSMIKVHPVTKRKALYIGRHAYAVVGLSEDESRTLLNDLLSFACQSPRTHAHRWQPGDLVIWDNRCVMHRARPYDYHEVRRMRHTRVAGDPATELATTVRDERASGFVPTGSNQFETVN